MLSGERSGGAAMKKIGLVGCLLLTMVLTATGLCAADGRGHGYGHGHGNHGRGGWGVVIVPGPVYPYSYAYPAYGPPVCENRCYDRLAPVCRRDSWGERWCYDKVVRECDRVCY